MGIETDSHTFVLRLKSNVPTAQELVRLGNAIDANGMDAARFDGGLKTALH